MAVNGWKYCNSKGNIQHLYVNSSVNGATIKFLIHIKFVKFVYQKVGSEIVLLFKFF